MNCELYKVNHERQDHRFNIMHNLDTNNRAKKSNINYNDDKNLNVSGATYATSNDSGNKKQEEYEEEREEREEEEQEEEEGVTRRSSTATPLPFISEQESLSYKTNSDVEHELTIDKSDSITTLTKSNHANINNINNNNNNNSASVIEGIVHSINKSISTNVEDTNYSTDTRGNVYRHIYNAKLHDSVNHIIDTLTVQLPEDHLLQQLLSDKITSQYVKLRIGEVVESVLYSAQAAQYHSLTGLLAESELQRVELAHHVHTLESNMNMLQIELEKTKEELSVSTQEISLRLHEQSENNVIRNKLVKHNSTTEKGYLKQEPQEQEEEEEEKDRGENKTENDAQALLLPYLLSADALRNELSNAREAQEIMHHLTNLIQSECQVTRSESKQENEPHREEEEEHHHDNNNMNSLICCNIESKELDNINVTLTLPSVTSKIIAHLFRTIYVFVEHLSSSLQNAEQLRREVHEHSSLEYCRNVIKDSQNSFNHNNNNDLDGNNSSNIIVNQDSNNKTVYESTIEAYTAVQNQLQELYYTLRESENQLVQFISEEHIRMCNQLVRTTQEKANRQIQHMEQIYKAKLKKCEEQLVTQSAELDKKLRQVHELETLQTAMQAETNELHKKLEEKEIALTLQFEKKEEQQEQEQEEERQRQKEQKHKEDRTMTILQKLAKERDSMSEQLSELEVENLCNVVESICNECELRYYECVNEKQMLLITSGYDALILVLTNTYKELTHKLECIEWNIQQSEISLHVQEENEEYFNRKLTEFATLMERSCVQLSHTLHVEHDETENNKTLKNCNNDPSEVMMITEEIKDVQSLHELFLSLHNSLRTWQTFTEQLTNKYNIMHEKSKEKDQEMEKLYLQMESLQKERYNNQNKLIQGEVLLQQSQQEISLLRQNNEEQEQESELTIQELKYTIDERLSTQINYMRSELRTLNEQLIKLEHTNANLHIRCTNAEYERSKLQRFLELRENGKCASVHEGVFASTPTATMATTATRENTVNENSINQNEDRDNNNNNNYNKNNKKITEDNNRND